MYKIFVSLFFIFFDFHLFYVFSYFCLSSFSLFRTFNEWDKNILYHHFSVLGLVKNLFVFV